MLSPRLCVCDLASNAIRSALRVGAQPRLSESAYVARRYFALTSQQCSLLQCWLVKSRPETRSYSSRRKVRTEHLSSALAVQPTWHEVLAATAGMQELPPKKCISCLNEIVGLAFEAGRGMELIQESSFRKLVDRVVAKVYGFSGRESYLLLAMATRIPGLLSRDQQISCFEQVCEDAAELNGQKLAHLSDMLAHLVCRRDELSRKLWDGHRSLLLLRMHELSAKEFVLVVSALVRARWSDTELLQACSNAAESHFAALSMPHLSWLTLGLTRLGLENEFLFAKALSCLGQSAGTLLPQQVSASLLSIALLGQPFADAKILTELQKWATARAHCFGPEDALHALRALCILRIFPQHLVLALLGRVSRVPRSALSEADDGGLHQVALSLLYEPAAMQALNLVRDSSDLWDIIYQPDDVVGNDEVNVAEDEQLADILMEVAVERGLEVQLDEVIECFYRLTAIVGSSSGRKEGAQCAIAIDFGERAVWGASHRDPWMRLRAMHLELIGGISIARLTLSEWRGLDHKSRRDVLELLFDVSEQP